MYLGGRRLAEEPGTNSAPGVTLLGAEGAHDLCETSVLCADTGTSEQNACRLPLFHPLLIHAKNQNAPTMARATPAMLSVAGEDGANSANLGFPACPGGRVLSGDDVAGHKRASARQVTALATPVVALTYRPQTVHRRRSLFIKAAPEGAGLSHPSSLAGGAVGRRPPRRTPPMAPRGFRSRRPVGLLLPPAEPAQRRFLIRARRRVSALLEPRSASRRQRATCR